MYDYRKRMRQRCVMYAGVDRSIGDFFIVFTFFVFIVSICFLDFLSLFLTVLSIFITNGILVSHHQNHRRQKIWNI